MDDLNEEQRQTFAGTLLMAMGLMFGAGAFGGILIFRLSRKMEPIAPEVATPFVVTAVAAASIVVMGMMPFVVSTLFPLVPNDTDETDKPENIWRSRKILQYAIAEGAFFANAVLYMLAGSGYSLAIAIAAVVVMLAIFPNTGQLKKWLARQADAEAAQRLNHRTF